MITVRGTSHIASEDLSEIRGLIREREPAVVAVELDEQRLYGLLHGRRGRRVGDPFLLLLRLLQRLLGRQTGVMPGADMVAAFETARELGIDVALVDQDIGVTLGRLRGEVPLREKVKLVGFLLFGWLVPGRRVSGEVDLSRVPDDAVVAEALQRLETGFPGLHRVLVVERNRVMAERLLALEARYGDVLAFVGAGHVAGIRDLLGDAEGS